jgi:hypothetical protein
VACVTPDLVGVIEAFYALDLPHGQWLGLVADKLRPLIDRDGVGVAAAIHECPDPCSFRPTYGLLLDVSDKFQAVFLESFQVLFEPRYVAESFLGRSCYMSTEIKGWYEVPSVRSSAMRDAGGVDVLQLNIMEPEGEGCWFGTPIEVRSN